MNSIHPFDALIPAPFSVEKRDGTIAPANLKTLHPDPEFSGHAEEFVQLAAVFGIRLAVSPDPDADQGTHHFTYAVHAHTGALNLPEVYTHAYDLNNPMTAVAVGGEKDAVPTEFALVECDKPNVLCEVIKEAEDSEDLIFRFFECSNSKTAATLRFGFDVEKVVLCDLNENSLKALSIENGTVLLSFGAFEIQTVKVTMKR